MSGFLVIANAEAGSAAQERLDAALDVLRAAGDVDLRRTEGVDDLDAALREGDDRRIIVAGGDGSVHLAVQRLWSMEPYLLSQTQLGLVPLGTGNDLAAGLGLPVDPAEAARVCVKGRARALDLITAGDGQVLVNAAHAGLGAEAAAESEGLKDYLHKLAYPVGALIAGVREPGYDLTITVDGRPVHEGPTLMVGVANAPRIGGGTRLAPPAVPDDGLLDVVVVWAVGPAARVAFGAALADGSHLERDDVAHIRGRSVTIAGEPVRHDVDGELTDELAERTYTVRPAAWQLLAPQRARGKPGDTGP